MSTPSRACRTCRHFVTAAAALEAAMAGLASLSSGYASVRSDDGLCTAHDRLIAASSVCELHFDIRPNPDRAGAVIGNLAVD